MAADLSIVAFCQQLDICYCPLNEQPFRNYLEQDIAVLNIVHLLQVIQRPHDMTYIEIVKASPVNTSRTRHIYVTYLQWPLLNTSQYLARI